MKFELTEKLPVVGRVNRVGKGWISQQAMVLLGMLSEPAVNHMLL